MLRPQARLESLQAVLEQRDRFNRRPAHCDGKEAVLSVLQDEPLDELTAGYLIKGLGATGACTRGARLRGQHARLRHAHARPRPPAPTHAHPRAHPRQRLPTGAHGTVLQLVLQLALLTALLLAPRARRLRRAGHHCCGLAH